MMPAAKMMDPVLGVDIHIVQPPGPVPPVPIPHPFVGMLFDPMELAPFIGASVFVNGMPKATAGSEGKALPPHIPIGGIFVPPPPGNECEMFMGSATVLFEGEPASYLALPALSCQSIGMPAPFRPKKKPKPILKLPTSVVLPIPMGAPVLIGGPPTISMSVIGMKLAMGAAGKAAGKLRKMQKSSKKAKAVSDRIHKAAKKAMDKLGVPPSVQNKVHKGICTVTGHPVDVATGKVFTDNVDFEIPGPIPLRWERTWYSCSTYEGPLGHGWHHSYDLELVGDGKGMAIRFGDGRPLAFPLLGVGESYFLRSEKVTLAHDSQGYSLRTQERLTYRFASQPSAKGRFPLSSISDISGNRILFAFDDHGDLEAIRDSSHRLFRFEKDWRGRILRILGPHPDVPGQDVVLMSYAYDDAGDMVEARDALNQAWRFAYKGHLLVRETNRNGLGFHFEYSDDGASARCIRTWGDGGIYDHKLAYDTEKRATTVEDSLGHKTIYYSADSGLVTKIVNPLGHASFTEYNAFNEVEREIDELGGETGYEYDERGNCIKVVEPDGASFEVRYSEGVPVAAKDVLGGDWKWEYDDKSRLVRRIDPLERVTTYRYLGTRLDAIINPAGGETKYRFGASGELLALIAPDGSETRWEYDFLGRCLASVDPLGNARRRKCDLLGRERRVEEPDGLVREYVYDAEGNVVRAVDQHHQVLFRFQGMNRIAARTEQGTTVEFHYDTEERLLGIRNEYGYVYRFELDPTGKVVVEKGFDGIRKKYVRDPKGRVAEIQSSSGLSTRYAYDAGDRIVKIRHSNGEETAYKYRLDGEMVEAANADIKIRFERDGLGNILREIQGEHAVESRYDDLGMRTEMKSSMGAHQRIIRDALGDVSRIAYGEDGEFPAWEVVLSRDPMGMELARSMPGGVKNRWSRDKVGRPVRHAIVSAQEYRARDYAWEGGDRLQSTRDSRHGLIAYEHDPRGYLVGCESPDGSRLFRVPDAVGNLFRSPDRDDRKYGPAGQLLESRGAGGITRFEYDGEGNLTRKIEPGERSWAYHWNATGMLAKVIRPDGLSVDFAYDALGRRISKSFRGMTTRWLWDGDNPLHEWMEADPDESSTASPGDWSAGIKPGAQNSPATWLFEPETFSPIAKLEGGKFYSIVTDHLGSPLALFDGEGQEAWSGTVDIFGRLTNIRGKEATCPFRFPGQYADEETGLAYNRLRYFDPESGQYTSQDPIGLAGGFRLHAYVLDPLVWIDPLGLEEDCPRLKQAQRRKLRQIEELAQTPGLSGLNSALTRRELNQLGRAFVGPGYTITRGRKGEIWMISKDGKRMYREPTAKRSPFARTGKQANFHQRRNQNSDWFDEQSTSNVHVHAD